MLSRDFIKLYIKDSAGQWVDYTDGLIGIETSTGLDLYVGAQQLPDTGQILITSRNKNLDPNINQNIKFNSDIKVELEKYGQHFNGTIFRGVVSDINIEYRPFGEDPIISINGIDVIGQFQRYILTFDDEIFCQESAYATEEGIDIVGLYELANLRIGTNYPLYLSWAVENSTVPIYPLARTFPKAGDNFLDLLTRYCQSNMLETRMNASENRLFVGPYFKHDPSYLTGDYSTPVGYTSYVDWVIQTGNLVRFNSDGSETSYKGINISNGFDRSLNQVIFNNTERTLTDSTINDSTTTVGPFNSTISYNQWATSNLTLDTCFNPTLNIDDTYETLSYDIIESVSTAGIEVSSITFDAFNLVEENPYIDIFGNGTGVYIRHQVSPTIIIDRLYEVCGVKVSIDPNNCYVTYILKVDKAYLLEDNLTNMPSISMNLLTGNTNTNFIGTINNVNISNIDYIGWNLAYQPIGPWGGGGRDLDHIVGDSQPTWNYDFGGPSGDDYGPGTKVIRLWLINNKKWTWMSFVYPGLTVTAAVPHADFTYDVNYGTVTFTDRSYDADTWIWDFGDGTTSNLQNPVHTYTTTGTKTVHLTVDNGVAQNTYTAYIPITVIPIPVYWTMIEFNAVQTRPNSSTAWDKNLPLSIAALIPLGGSYFNTTNTEKSSPKNTTGQTNAYNGNVYASYPNWTGLAPVGSGASDATWYQLITDGGYGTSTWMEIVPVTTNSGNTRTINVKVYFKNEFAYQGGYGVTGFNGLFVTDRAGVGSALTYYEAAKTYEKIKIYISPNTTTSFPTIKNDTSSWVEVGYIQVANLTPTEVNNGYFYRSMTPIRTMPPQL